MAGRIADSGLPRKGRYTPGQALRAARLALGLNQAEFGERVGLGQVGVSPYERDEQNILRRAPEFAAALEMTLPTFLQLIGTIDFKESRETLRQWWDQHRGPYPGLGQSSHFYRVEETRTPEPAAMGTR